MLNACVVGFGQIGPVHANAINKIGNVYGICDCIKERADLGANRFGAKAFYSFDEVLNDKNVDVVHICTPHYLHTEMAINALKADKHVLVEKPLGINLDELAKLESFYKKCDKKACVMFQTRTNAAIIKLKYLIDNDTSLGRMLGISGFLTWQRDENYYNADAWRGKWETEGGGVLINQAIHTLDLINYLGSGIKAVKGSISNFTNNFIEVEDTAQIIFEMNNGCRGTLFATNGFKTSLPIQIDITFENCILRYADNRLYKITDKNCETLTFNAEFTSGKKVWGNGHESVISQFYEAIENDTDNYLDLLSGIHSTKVVLSIYKNQLNTLKEWIKI